MNQGKESINNFFQAVIALCMIACIIHCQATPTFAEKPVPETVADSAILIDAKTGYVLYDKDMHKVKYPASTTKVMTALLAIENLDLTKTIVIDDETPYTKGARIYLIEEEQVTGEELLYAMLVESANDAAVALAKAVSGSTKSFAKLMNKRAEELGAINTNFVNPNGLEHDDHVTSAYDLAMITKEAMKHEVFRDAVATYQYDLRQTNKQEERHLYNSNRLLYDEKRTVVYEGETIPMKYDDAIGIKTGYTQQAGSCLIAGAERNGMELIAVILQSYGSDLYLDAISLLEFGFANYKTVSVLEDGAALGTLTVKNGEVKSIGAKSGSDVIVTLPFDGDPADVKLEMSVDTVTAPIKKGEEIGTVAITFGDWDLGQVPLMADADVARGGLLSYIGVPDKVAKIIRNTIIGIFIGLVALLVLYIILKRRQIKRIKKRRAEKRARYEAYVRMQEQYYRENI